MTTNESAGRRVAVVTGAARGIGEAIARRLSADGLFVVVADVDEDAGMRVAAEIGGSFKRCDVATASDVEGMVADIVDDYGSLDVCVANAGVAPGAAPTHAFAVDEWERVLQINGTGAFLTIKYALAAMLKQKTGGVLLITASVCGLKGQEGIAPYTFTKWGLVGLVKGVALEYAKAKIRINAVCPTTTETPLVEKFIEAYPDPAAKRAELAAYNPMPGIVQTVDIAEAAAFLCSDRARFITGVSLPVDGGLLSGTPEGILEIHSATASD